MDRMKKIVAGAVSLLAVCGMAMAQDRGRAAGSAWASDEKPAAAETDPGVSADSVTFWLHLLHTNDGESRVRPVFVSPGSGQPAVGPYGGAAYFKTRVDQLRSFAATYPAGPEPRGVVMVSSGDNFLAGPEFNASLGLPATERFYDAVAMQLIGFDAITPGNHDFDFGPEVFARFVSGFTDGTPFVSANLDFSSTPSVQPLVASGRVRRSVVLNVGGRQVGVVGATTTLLPFISSPVTVVVVPLLPVIQAEVDALTSLGVSIIVLSSHLQNLSQEFQLVSQLRDVDAVVGGGGSEILANPGTPLVPGQTANSTPLGGTGYPRLAVDSTGRNVPVVTTFGEYRYVGRLVLGFNALGEVVAVDPISDVVRVSGRVGDPDAVMPDAAVQSQVVDPVSASVSQLAANVLASSQVALDGRRAIVRTRESNQGNLGADSLLWQTAVLAAGSGHPIPNVALQNGGGIRNNAIIPAGPFTELNTFEINPFANFVVNIPSVSPEQFKIILENAVSRVAQEDGRFAQVAGFTMTWDAARQPLAFGPGGTQISFPGERVRSVVLNDGRVIVRDGAVVPGAPSVNIATINFLATGGDQYPLNFAGFSNPFFSYGVSYQQALASYVVDVLSGLIRSQDYPVGGEGRIVREN